MKNRARKVKKKSTTITFKKTLDLLWQRRQRMFATVAQKTMKESAVLSIEVRNVMKYKNHSTKLGVFFSRLRFVAVLECITISLSSLV